MADNLSRDEIKKRTLEKQREESRQAQKDHQEREERFRLEQEKKARKKKMIMGIIALSLLIVAAIIAYGLISPGKYDDFAKCLTEKGAVMYGAIAWCQYTQAQAGMFGKSFKYINYQDESKLTGIKTRPTWVINGKWLEKVQSFEALSEVTGCQLK